MKKIPKFFFGLKNHGNHLITEIITCPDFSGVQIFKAVGEETQPQELVIVFLLKIISIIYRLDNLIEFISWF